MLLASAALLMLWPAAAQAQTPDPNVTMPGNPLIPRELRGQNLQTSPIEPPPRPRAAPVNNDGLEPGELYMEADQLTRDDKSKITTAEGHVEVRYEGRTIRADRLVYQEGESAGLGIIRAYGHVVTLNADGTTEFADELTLDDKMRAGVALGFSARLQQNVKIAGATAIKRNENVQQLNKAIYTPCPICVGDTPKTPTWSISADSVVQDKAKRIVYYRNARIHVLGATVLYLPVFWHADPQAGRASGFLTPKIGVSDRRGFSYEQPYLWVISPYSDLVLSPQINSKVNPFLNGELRKRFYSGDVDARFGVTKDQDFDGKGNAFGNNTIRSYILAQGVFRPAPKWRAGFTAERTSDDLIFDKYEIGRVYEARGPYIADDRRLISQVYAIRQDTNSYVSAAAFSIQGLRPGDIDRTFPLVAPVVESHYEPQVNVLGGRLRLNGSAVVLTRDQSPTSPELRLPGLDSRRVTADADWRRSFTSAAGLRVEPFVNLRVDGYSLHDVLTGVGSATRSQSTSRALAVAGADISYPLYRRWKAATVVVEPLAQIAVSPDAHQIVVGRDATGQPIYLNEDSVAFEFDETNLFRANKFPGFDLYEDGARINVAGRASVLWDDGRRASFLLGRSFRDKTNDVFGARSGLRGRSSDWIVATDAQPITGVTLFARARLDSDNLKVHRAEAGVNVSNKFGSGYVRYLTDDFDVNLTNPLDPLSMKRENLDLGGEVYFGKNWGVSAYGNRDIAQAAWVIRDIGVFYRDDCTRVDVIYRREDTVIGRLGPSSTVSIRLTLATLGGPLYAR
ncbi:MAG: organic solvent tolerance protein OstA [Phenylobacterium sp.]|nr:organic solvent tolerance protein OstA [Phenylobacterium sp.]